MRFNDIIQTSVCSAHVTATVWCNGRDRTILVTVSELPLGHSCTLAVVVACVILDHCHRDSSWL